MGKRGAERGRGKRGEVPEVRVSGQVERGERVPGGGIETFRLSVGGCPCYQRIVNVCGARRAPALPGRVPHSRRSRAAAPCRPRGRSQGLSPAPGPDRPAEAGRVLSPSRFLRRGSPWPFVPLCATGVHPVPFSETHVFALPNIEYVQECGACGRTCFSITLGAAWPGEDALGTSAEGRREPSPAEVGSRPDLGGRRPSPGWCAEHVPRRRCLRHHRGTSWVTPRARSSRAVPRGRRARRGAGRVR